MTLKKFEKKNLDLYSKYEYIATGMHKAKEMIKEDSEKLSPKYA